MRIAPAQPLLDYRGRSEADISVPRPIWAFASTVPLLFCWTLFASAAMPRELPILERMTVLFGMPTATKVLLVVWGGAGLTSIAALIYFLTRPRAWYTLLCSALHLAGLAFSLLLLAGVVILIAA